jgi:hypothetical protein
MYSMLRGQSQFMIYFTLFLEFVLVCQTGMTIQTLHIAEYYQCSSLNKVLGLSDS